VRNRSIGNTVAIVMVAARAMFDDRRMQHRIRTVRRGTRFEDLRTSGRRYDRLEPDNEQY